MPEIHISVPKQEMKVLRGRKCLATYPISTSKYGLGSEPGSNKTPLGKFRVAAKIGSGALWGTIFMSRQAVGLWSPAFETDNDLITSRILWLEGTEKANANTHSRYIYIHGTNQEHLLGTPASHGCIRMRNHDVISLYDLVDEKARVVIR
jgi:lipoprotein-anchoring transpeptidase ErfK/SrfK